MPVFETKNLGRISYTPEAVVEFPRGLPGFESQRRFAVVQFADSVPLVFLQSLENAGLSFICLPVLAVDPQYRLEIGVEDLAGLGLPESVQPRIGEDVLCLAVLTLKSSGPTANLLAPIVINLHNRTAMQPVMPEAGYSHQHELLPAEQKMEGQALEIAACL